jgi:hypothetical protein
VDVIVVDDLEESKAASVVDKKKQT